MHASTDSVPSRMVNKMPWRSTTTSSSPRLGMTLDSDESPLCAITTDLIRRLGKLQTLRFALSQTRNQRTPYERARNHHAC